MGVSTATLKQALAEFDAGDAARFAAWSAAETAADCETCAAIDAAALTKVREAFWAITQDRNSRDGAMLADLRFMRRIASLDEI